MAQPYVVLVGPPGAGKSTIGRRLASALKVQFIDSDDLIAAEFAKPCGEVYAQLGEKAFRTAEAEQVARALTVDGVVSLGGGAVVTAAVRDALQDMVVVWIDVSAEEGVRRTGGDNSRPVLASENPVKHYQALKDSRAEFYKEVASFYLRSDKRRPQEMVADILAFLETLDDTEHHTPEPA